MRERERRRDRIKKVKDNYSVYFFFLYFFFLNRTTTKNVKLTFNDNIKQKQNKAKNEMKINQRKL